MARTQAKRTKSKRPSSHSQKAKTLHRKKVSRPKREESNIIRTLRDKIIGPSEVITNEKLLEFLSEFLAVEKGGTELYTAAVNRSTDPEIKKNYKTYLDQTKNHARIITAAIQDLGGDPSFMSPGAIAQEKLGKAMLSLEVPKELRELKDAENLLLAETKDHMDWEFLKKISSKVEGDTKRLLKEMVSQVEDEEDEHLKFAKKAVETLSLRVAVSPVKDENTEKLAA